MNDQADFILKMDKQQSISNPNAIFCALNHDHGRLQITRDAMAIMCGVKGCNFMMMPTIIEEEQEQF